MIVHSATVERATSSRPEPSPFRHSRDSHFTIGLDKCFNRYVFNSTVSSCLVRITCNRYLELSEASFHRLESRPRLHADVAHYTPDTILSIPIIAGTITARGEP